MTPRQRGDLAWSMAGAIVLPLAGMGVAWVIQGIAGFAEIMNSPPAIGLALVVLATLGAALGHRLFERLMDPYLRLEADLRYASASELDPERYSGAPNRLAHRFMSAHKNGATDTTVATDLSLSTVVAALPVAMIVTRPDNRIALYNSRARSLFDSDSGIGLDRDFSQYVNSGSCTLLRNLAQRLFPHAITTQLTTREDTLLPVRVVLLEAGESSPCGWFFSERNYDSESRKIWTTVAVACDLLADIVSRSDRRLVDRVPQADGARMVELDPVPFATTCAMGSDSIMVTVEGNRFLVFSEDNPQPLIELPMAERQEAKPHRPEFYRAPCRPLAASLGLSSPLSQLKITAFDTETTGLDPSKDRVCSVGAVRVVAGQVLEEERFDLLVNPRRPIPDLATQIHGITESMVAHQPTLESIMPQFERFVGDSVLLGHNLAFDLAVLQAEGHTRWVDTPVLDTLLLSYVLYPEPGEHSLDHLARRFSIAPIARHSALGDAVMTAHLFVKLLPALSRHGIETLGDAIEASRETALARLSYL